MQKPSCGQLAHLLTLLFAGPGVKLYYHFLFRLNFPAKILCLFPVSSMLALYSVHLFRLDVISRRLGSMKLERHFLFCRRQGLVLGGIQFSRARELRPDGDPTVITVSFAAPGHRGLCFVMGIHLVRSFLPNPSCKTCSSCASPFGTTCRVRPDRSVSRASVCELFLNVLI